MTKAKYEEASTKFKEKYNKICDIIFGPFGKNTLDVQLKNNGTKVHAIYDIGADMFYILSTNINIEKAYKKIN